MTSPFQKIIDSKCALRRELASRPLAEKLQMLDAMREREVAIRTRISSEVPALEGTGSVSEQNGNPASAHRESSGLHRESPGLHWESPGLHRESPGLRRESVGLHCES